MSLRLYDTATRTVRTFVPRHPGKAGIYLCGLTVQAGPHIGHLRSGVNYDVLRRWLQHSGYDVTFVRNITDIDDRILAKAVEQGRPFWSIAYANEVVLSAAYRTLGVLPPTCEPRATGHIPEMHELIATLIADGHAYPAGDGSGDVYFATASYPDYGALSGQRVDEVRVDEDCEPGKRDSRDFALWKGAKPGEPADASWPSPWGRGRPGWHIECSAMCWRYLGPEFDIHGGGLDLVFPHHENEVAQSRAAGLPFARYWVHHGLLNLGDAKMSKSLGNVLDLAAVAALGVRPVELRYYLASPHYRSRIDYSAEALRESAVAYRRIEGFVHRAIERVGDPGPGGAVVAGVGVLGEAAADGGVPGVAGVGVPGGAGAGTAAPSLGVSGLAASGNPVGSLPQGFVAALNDDLNTAAALAELHEVIRAGNTALAAEDDEGVRRALIGVRAMLGILGVDPLDVPWRGETRTGDLRGVVDSLVALALEQRAKARERRDWAAADAVRDQLKQAGVTVEDTAHGPRWTVEDH